MKFTKATALLLFGKWRRRYRALRAQSVSSLLLARKTRTAWETYADYMDTWRSNMGECIFKDYDGAMRAVYRYTKTQPLYVEWIELHGKDD